jgi:hypothetical protein
MLPLNLIRNSALYLSFFLITANNFVFGQAPAIEWQKCFGSYDGDYCNSMLVTLDGGYIMAGYTEGVDGGDVMGYHGEQGWADIWLVKTDNKGNIQWQKCLG